MPYILDAACLCKTGKVRRNNEDNFFLDGRCLDIENNGLEHPVITQKPLRYEQWAAIFDGMGGENFGEYASYAAADCMRHITEKKKEFFIPRLKLLNNVCKQINEAVVAKQQEFCTDHMGSTMVALYFFRGYAYVCNLGDSRAYHLRNNNFLQVSVDDTEKLAANTKKKPPMTQHLGINPEDCIIEPHIAKEKIMRGDQYLLCSDGLTDMLSDSEINEIMVSTETSDICVRKLIDAALEKGGRDNVTAIVCRII